MLDIDKLKVKSNVLSERLSQDNISIVKLDEMLRLMDYKIVIVPRETREQEGWYRVEWFTPIFEYRPKTKTSPDRL